MCAGANETLLANLRFVRPITKLQQSLILKKYPWENLTSANGQPWFNAMVGMRMVTFKVDNGTDMTVIPATAHSAQTMETRYDSKEQLLGAGGWPITVPRLVHRSIGT